MRKKFFPYCRSPLTNRFLSQGKCYEYSTGEVHCFTEAWNSRDFLEIRTLDNWSSHLFRRRATWKRAHQQLRRPRHGSLPNYELLTEPVRSKRRALNSTKQRPMMCCRLFARALLARSLASVTRALAQTHARQPKWPRTLALGQLSLMRPMRRDAPSRAHRIPVIRASARKTRSNARSSRPRDH